MMDFIPPPPSSFDFRIMIYVCWTIVRLHEPMVNQSLLFLFICICVCFNACHDLLFIIYYLLYFKHSWSGAWHILHLATVAMSAEASNSASEQIQNSFSQLDHVADDLPTALDNLLWVSREYFSASPTSASVPADENPVIAATKELLHRVHNDAQTIRTAAQMGLSLFQSSLKDSTHME